MKGSRSGKRGLRYWLNLPGVRHGHVPHVRPEAYEERAVGFFHAAPLGSKAKMGYVMLRTENVVAPGLFHTFANWVNPLG